MAGSIWDVKIPDRLPSGTNPGPVRAEVSPAPCPGERMAEKCALLLLSAISVRRKYFMNF